MNRRSFAAALGIASSMLLAGALPAPAKEFPTKPITVIVPQPAGGATDVLVRAMGEVIAKNLGQPVVVDNKPGATGTLGPTTMAVSAKPDGYTVSVMLSTVHRLPLQQKMPYDAVKDFTYIMNLGGYAFTTYAGASTPFKKWGDVVAYAKANPGKVSYASTGVGGSLHLAMEQLAGELGIQLTHVPFSGGAEIQAAVAGGHTMLGIDTPGVKPLADAGKVRLLSAWTNERIPLFPDVPTMAELGHPIVIASNFGLAGPKGMNEATVKVLHDAFKAALEAPRVTEMMAKLGMMKEYRGTEEYRAWILKQIEAEKQLLEKLGIIKK
jgi:tripartite-type tricarboxylate transporter receptor subunit TctC